MKVVTLCLMALYVTLCLMFPINHQRYCYIKVIRYPIDQTRHPNKYTKYTNDTVGSSKEI